MRRPQRSTLFPYTTLFRSIGRNTTEGIESVEQPGARLVHRTLFPHGVLHTERTDFFAKQHNDLTRQDRKSTRLNSSHVRISYAVFCLKKKIQRGTDTNK